MPDDPRFVYEVAVPDPARSGLKPPPQPGRQGRRPAGRVEAPARAADGRNRRAASGAPTSRARSCWASSRSSASSRAFPPRSNARPPPCPTGCIRATWRAGSTSATSRSSRSTRTTPRISTTPSPSSREPAAICASACTSRTSRTTCGPGTALDREAQRRGNSTYLVGTVIPMLPEKLSNGLCSLVEGQDRLCKAVIFTFGRNGRIEGRRSSPTPSSAAASASPTGRPTPCSSRTTSRDPRACPCRREHQTGSTGRPLRELSDGELVDLQSLARGPCGGSPAASRQERMAHGSLDLDMPETKIFVDEEGYADRLERIEQDESHQLIEEFMLAANEAVAAADANPPAALALPGPRRPGRGEARGIPAVCRDLRDPGRRPHPPGGGRQAAQGPGEAPPGLHAADAVPAQPEEGLLPRHPGRPLRPAQEGLHPFHLADPPLRGPGRPPRRWSPTWSSTTGRPAAGRAGYDIRGVESLAEHLSLTEINSAEAERESVKIKLLEFFERELARKNAHPLCRRHHRRAARTVSSSNWSSR